MSGSKQHFIPQSLLKGFGVRAGKSTLVVAYTRDRGIFTPATEGIAAQRHFYSELGVEGETETLDDKITLHERPLATVLSKIRSLTNGELVDAEEAAAFVTHLAVRNDHFRRAVTQASSAMINIVADQFSGADGARTLLGLDGDVPRGAFAEQLVQAFEQYRPLVDALGMDRATFNQWAFANVKSNFDTYHREISGPMIDAVSAVIAAVPETVANAQRKVLDGDLVPAQRAERMARLDWQVIHSPKPLILPDCVAIGVDAEGGVRPLMLFDLAALETVFLPISSNRLLVGTTGSLPKIPSSLNAMMAGCSWDFFVARDRTSEMETLRGTLRSLVIPFLDGLVDGAVAEALKG